MRTLIAFIVGLIVSHGLFAYGLFLCGCNFQKGEPLMGLGFTAIVIGLLLGAIIRELSE